MHPSVHVRRASSERKPCLVSQIKEVPTIMELWMDLHACTPVGGAHIANAPETECCDS